MRVSRENSGGLPSIIWLRSFHLPAMTCCHSTVWLLAARKPAQRPHLLPVPRDVGDSVLADNLLLAMPRPPARLCAREAAGSSKGCVCGLFCDAQTLVRIGVFWDLDPHHFWVIGVFDLRKQHVSLVFPLTRKSALRGVFDLRCALQSQSLRKHSAHLEHF